MTDENNNGVRITNKEIYTELQTVKNEVLTINANLTNHLEHHKQIENKNIAILGIIVAVVSILVNIIFKVWRP